jgi:Arc/MetJ-type ribon-helix-helix transcriptional regulator
MYTYYGGKVMRSLEVKSKVFRPEIKDRSAEIIEMFVSRGYFKTQSEVVEAGLEMLLEHQLVEDSKLNKEEAMPMSSSMVKGQVE